MFIVSLGRLSFLYHTVMCVFSMAIITLFSGCDDPGMVDARKSDEKAWTELLDSAAWRISSDPVAATQLADAALKIAASGKLPDTAIFRPLELKAEAMWNMRKKDSALHLLDSARTLANDLGESALLARLMLKTGSWRHDLSDLSLAEKHVGDAVRLYKKLKRDKEYASSLQEFGEICRHKGDFIRSQKSMLESIGILEKYKDYKQLGYAYLNVGNLFKDIGNAKDANIYYRKGLDALGKLGDSSQLVPALRLLGLVKRNIDPDSAIYYYAISNRFDPDKKNPASYIMGLYNTANIYLDRNEFDKARSLFDSVYAFCKKEKMYGGMARVLNAYGILAMVKGDDVLAEKTFTKAIELADSIGEKDLEALLMQSKAEFYESKGRLASALALERESRKLRDSLVSAEGKLEILRMEKEFQSEKKEMDNADLRMENARLVAYGRLRSTLVWLSVMVSIVMSLLFYYTRRLQKEKSLAYEALMQRYQNERDFRQSDAEASKTTEIIQKRYFIKRDEQELMNALLDLFEQKKPYLDSQLKISDVAELLNTTTRNITNALKGYKASKFSEFVNIFRVDEAKRLMENPQYANMTIEAIARDAGFGTKQSFYNTFETITGVKPSHYRTHILITV